MIRIILGEKKWRNESKAEALNLIRSALDFQSHAVPFASHMPPIDSTLQSDEMRYNAPAQVIGLPTKLLRNGGRENKRVRSSKMIEIIC